MCLGVPSIDLLFVSSYLIKYPHKSMINDFRIFGIHMAIFKLEPSNFAHFENLSCFKHKFLSLPHSNMAVFYDQFSDSLINFISDFVSA